MKKIALLSSLVVLAFVFLSTTIAADSGTSFDARINTYKHECKQLIKPFRYEGSRVTYFTGQKEDFSKNVEAFLVIDTEYKFAFSGKECSTKTMVRIYDSGDEKKRTLLKEIKNIQGKNVLVSSTDLASVYRKKVSGSERLKVVYIEYKIAGGSSKNEAIVMVVGYKD